MKHFVICLLLSVLVVGCSVAVDEDGLKLQGAGGAIGIVSVLPDARQQAPDDAPNPSGECENCYGTGRSGDGHSICQVCNGTGKTAVQDLAESLFGIVDVKVVEVHTSKPNKPLIDELEASGFTVKVILDSTDTWYKLIARHESVRVDGDVLASKLIEIHEELK